ncbi:MAG TPA: hypothetical protein VJY33_10075 [Isosphaeraceae bacterium]|nr:hypothetical protein [Isosphaeraceae bacterium]
MSLKSHQTSQGVTTMCTGITIKTPLTKDADGSIVFARTLEFATDIKSEIIVVPRGTE